MGMSAPKNVYKFDLVCLDRGTGKVIWQKTACEAMPHQGHHRDHGFASFSPVTDGKLIWASFGSRGIYCFDFEGNKIWSKESPKMKTMFGEGCSPMLAGDAIIVLTDHSGDSSISAFDKKTGDLLWKKDRDEATSYATPLPVMVGGKLQVITSATSLVRSYDAATGDIVWQCGGQTRNVIPTPVVGFGMVYCTSGYRGSALKAIKLGRTGDLTGTDAVVWEVGEATPYVPSPLLYEGRLYVCDVNKEVISCYDARTGKPYFVKQKMDEMKGVYASPSVAAGRIYFVGRNGVTYVIKPGEKFEVLAINKLDDAIDCSPAFVGDEMFLKGKKHLYCIAK
jgi:outer membrane protein assembly factor BamB